MSGATGGGRATLGTELDGYVWELSVEPATLIVEMRRTRFPLVDGAERGALHTEV